MISPLRLIASHRHILVAITLNEIKARYVDTVAGLLWVAMYPMIFLGMYAVVYMKIFKVSAAGLTSAEYMLVLFTGLIPFLGFAEALGTGAGSVLANKGLMRNTLFPIDLIPVKAVLLSSVGMMVGTILALMAMWVRGYFFATHLLVPVALILQIMFTIGVTWILSALNVFFKDLSQLINIIVLFFMLISPIAYTQDMMPENMRLLMYVNPLHYIITLYRDCVLNGHLPLDALAGVTLMSLASFWIGHLFFSRLKGAFIDYV